MIMVRRIMVSGRRGLRGCGEGGWGRRLMGNRAGQPGASAKPGKEWAEEGTQNPRAALAGGQSASLCGPWQVSCHRSLGFLCAVLVGTVVVHEGLRGELTWGVPPRAEGTEGARGPVREQDMPELHSCPLATFGVRVKCDGWSPDTRSHEEDMGLTKQL